MATKNDTEIALITQKIETIDSNVKEIKDKLEKEYVTTDKLKLYVERIDRLEKLVYGMVGIILTAVILAIIKLVVIQ